MRRKVGQGAKGLGYMPRSPSNGHLFQSLLRKPSLRLSLSLSSSFKHFTAEGAKVAEMKH